MGEIETKRYFYDLRDESRPWAGVTISLSFTVFGVALWLQSSRWYNTPSYALLLKLLGTHAWGTLYLICAVLMFVHLTVFKPAWFAILAHTASAMLVVFWLVAFVIRYFTDSGTTIVNVVSWSILLTLLVHSALSIDEASYKSTLPDDRQAQ